MEHELIVAIGMAAAFILGAKVGDLRLPRLRRKPGVQSEQEKREDVINKQMRALMGYTEDDYGKRG